MRGNSNNSANYDELATNNPVNAATSSSSSSSSSTSASATQSAASSSNAEEKSDAEAVNSPAADPKPAGRFTSLKASAIYPFSVAKEKANETFSSAKSKATAIYTSAQNTAKGKYSEAKEYLTAVRNAPVVTVMATLKSHWKRILPITLGAISTVYFRKELLAAASTALSAAQPYASAAVTKGAELGTSLVNHAINKAIFPSVAPITQHFASHINSGLSTAAKAVGTEWMQNGLFGAMGLAYAAHSAYCLYNLYKNGGKMDSSKALAYATAGTSLVLSAMTALSPASPINPVVVFGLNVITNLMAKNAVDKTVAEKRETVLCNANSALNATNVKLIRENTALKGPRGLDVATGFDASSASSSSFAASDDASVAAYHALAAMAYPVASSSSPASPSTPRASISHHDIYHDAFGSPTSGRPPVPSQILGR